MLNLDNLNVFVIAAETQNFSRAAQQLNLSQPAVSQQIQALEQHLRVQLFERRGRRIRLSPAGATLLSEAHELLRQSRKLEESAMALAGEVVGHLAIGCSTTSGKYVLPRLLAQYRQQYPLVKAAVDVGSRSQVLEWLISGQVGLAVTSERVDRGGLRYHRFFEDEIVMVVPAGHPWIAQGFAEPKDLYEERFVLREPESGTHLALLEGLEAVGADARRLESVLTLGNSEAIVMAVEEGIGLGFVPRVTAERCLALGRVAVVPVRGLVMRRWLYLVDNTTRSQPPALRAFWDYVEALLSEEGLAAWSSESSGRADPVSAAPACATGNGITRQPLLSHCD